jgi:hypothetical protein
LPLRSSIDQAQRHEAHNPTLRSFVRLRLPTLHRSIGIPEKGGEDALLDFLTRYIEHVPDFLEAMAELAQAAGIYSFIERFVHIAESFFLQPPSVVREQPGLLALLDEAYLSHRLMEEVNDRVMAMCDAPLIPMDMTNSNLIVHSLLGEWYANALDQAVHCAVDGLFEGEALSKNTAFCSFAALNQGLDWKIHLQRWPCLAGDNSIGLFLGQPGRMH